MVWSVAVWVGAGKVLRWVILEEVSQRWSYDDATGSGMTLRSCPPDANHNRWISIVSAKG